MAYRYCPRCGAEYREGFDLCSDCGVELVDQPPAPEEEEHFPALDPRHIDYVYREGDWAGGLEPVCVKVVKDEMESEIILSVFRAHQLRAFAEGGPNRFVHHGPVVTPEAIGLGRIRILVHPGDADSARELLELADEAAEEEAFDYSDDDVSDDIEASIGGEPLAAPAGAGRRLIQIGAVIVLCILVFLLGSSTCDAANAIG